MSSRESSVEPEAVMDLDADQEQASTWTVFAPRKSLMRSPPAAGGGSQKDGKRPLTSPDPAEEKMRTKAGRRRPAPVSGALPAAGILNSPRMETPRHRTAASGSGPGPAPVPAPGPQVDPSPGAAAVGAGTPAATPGLTPETVAVTMDNVAAAPEPSPEDKLMNASRMELLSWASAAVDGIMECATATNSKLNKAEIAKIGCNTTKVMSVVAALNLKLAEMELAMAKTELKCAAQRQQWMKGSGAGTSSGDGRKQDYATILKLPGKEPPQVKKPTATAGSVLAFYPKDSEDADLKTAEATKLALRNAIDPSKMGVQVSKMRKVGNSGVVVETTTKEAAEKLKRAMPGNLRVTTPKKKLPLVALRNIDGDPAPDSLLKDLFVQNLDGHDGWTLDRTKRDCKVAFKKSRRGSGRTTVVLECAPAARDFLVGRGRVYLGWESIEVCDFISVTCCSKCQMYGHPERHCRSKETTCGSCGVNGHRAEECKARVKCCATCKRFGKPSADHVTAAPSCPARKYAEDRSLSITNYG